jgi:hypothetical protein
MRNAHRETSTQPEFALRTNEEGVKGRGPGSPPMKLGRHLELPNAASAVTILGAAGATTALRN